LREREAEGVSLFPVDETSIFSYLTANEKGTPAEFDEKTDSAL
jgi:hypothetical protein